jgi:hypothetical protein
MRTPAIGNRLPPRVTWAADSGLYDADDAARAARIAAFSFDAYLAWLDGHTNEEKARCLFATAPDVVGNAVETWAWERQADAFRRIHATGHRPAFVAQPGAHLWAWAGEMSWRDFSCLFVGGDDAWQDSNECLHLVAIARAAGKWRHRGRVNSEKRLLESWRRGFESCDGTLLRYGLDTNLPGLRRALAEAEGPPPRPLLDPLEDVRCGMCGVRIGVDAAYSERDHVTTEEIGIVCVDCAHPDPDT